jgi:SAM-dependent methyltransferase
METPWARIAIQFDENAITLDDLRQKGAAGCLSAAEALPMLADPDDRSELRCSVEGTLSFSDGTPVPMLGQRPVLLPAFARSQIKDGRYHFDTESLDQPGMQYLYLAHVKAHGGEQNSAYGDIWYERHLFRARRLTEDARGSLLDIGCDTPEISSRMFPPAVAYIGLEPSLARGEQFCICGMAEFLPFHDASFDNVALMTSLDHILDAPRAIEEAFRVLRPGGSLYLASLVWLYNASLVKDTVHFHHFRDWQLQGLLREFVIESIQRYGWKDNQHRYGIYLKATKPGAA